MDKIAKGTRDFGPQDVLIREQIITKIKRHFLLYGLLPIDTPVFECFTSVQALYGEEFNKSVYTIDNNSEEKLIMRYDLTLPYARYLVSNGIENFKRCQLGKVYRKDAPNLGKGRFREFYQFDADITGSDNGLMIQDTEMLCLNNDIFNDLLGKGTFKIRVNSKKVLFDVLAKIHFDNKDFNTICSSLDKLDKMTWTEVCQELTLVKNFPMSQVFLLSQFVELVKKGITLEILLEHEFITKETYDEMSLLFSNIKSVNLESVVFDPLLSRGLDYYTGLIYETEYFDKEIMPSSIAAGGRYDNMLALIGTKGVIPSIGLSIGIERVVSILEQISKNDLVEIPRPVVFIGTVGKDMSIHKLKLAQELRHMGILVDYLYKPNPKMREQLDQVFNKGIPLMIILGQDEITNNTVNLKCIKEKTQMTIPRSALETSIKLYLS